MVSGAAPRVRSAMWTLLPLLLLLATDLHPVNGSGYSYSPTKGFLECARFVHNRINSTRMSSTRKVKFPSSNYLKTFARHFIKSTFLEFKIWLRPRGPRLSYENKISLETR